jgi:hypothetical protein
MAAGAGDDIAMKTAAERRAAAAADGDVVRGWPVAASGALPARRQLAAR